MKKIIITILSLIFATSLTAQNYPKEAFSIKTGLTISSWEMVDLWHGGYYCYTAPNLGYHIEGSYQRLLTDRVPLYIETGIGLTTTGAEYIEEEAKYTSLYANVPILFNYRFSANDIIIYPSVGFDFAFGISGTAVDTYDGEKYSYDTFDKERGLLRRPDFGIRIGATAELRNILLSVSYGRGLINTVVMPEDKDDLDFIIKNKLLKLSIGYRF